MERIVDKGAESVNARLTDEMIAKANAFVDTQINNEVKERYCRVWADHYIHFVICCTTSMDYRNYMFSITDDGDIKFQKMEGDFRY